MKRLIQAAVGGLACWVATTAGALTIPIQFSITNGVRNEFGDILPGTSIHSPSFGVPYIQGALVQVLDVSAGVYPPDTNGVAHPSNPVLAITYIGEGINPTFPESGKSSGVVGNLGRSSTNSWIMLRVFNKPTLDEASFYGESAPFHVTAYGDEYSAMYASVGDTTIQTDTNDVDADGLSRSWEKSYGTDPTKADTDDDGMIDGHEIRAGTGPLDPTSLLIVVQINPPTAAGVPVSWDAVSGKTYRLQYTTNNLSDEPTFIDIDPPVTATGLVATLLITNDLPAAANLRVRLVE